jgi:ribosomal protein L37E
MGFWENKMSGAVSPPRSLPPMPGQRVTHPPLRRHVPVDTNCPECGSPNYGSSHGNGAKTCFECGFGNAYRNSTSGGPTIRSEGAVKAAKQIPTAGYRPQEIVGRLQ